MNDAFAGALLTLGVSAVALFVIAVVAVTAALPALVATARSTEPRPAKGNLRSRGFGALPAQRRHPRA